MKLATRSLVLSLLSSLVVTSALAGNEDTFTFKNETGKEVNDLHIDWTRQVDIKSVDIFKKTSGSGTGHADFKKGDVKKDGSVDVTVTWEGGDPKVKSWYWTIDGEKVRDEKVSSVTCPAGYILPTEIDSGSPFMFTASGLVEGEVVTIQTVNGEVVTQARTDNRGRAYLAAGLAAGVYSLVANHGGSQSVRQVDIKPNLIGAQQNPASMSLNQLNPLKMADPIMLSGSGINPDPASLQASFQGIANSRPMIVGAATPKQIILGSPASMGLKPGDLGSIALKDDRSGQSANTNQTLVFDARAELTRKAIPGGSETHLIIFCEPWFANPNATAEVLDGPVSLGNGLSQQTMQINQGKADFLIRSMPGSSGTFNVTWRLDWTGVAQSFVPLAQDKPKNKEVWSQDRQTFSEYDAAGHLVHEAKYDKDGNPTEDSTWDYDDKGRCRGRRTIRWNKDGTTTEEKKSWDEKNRPTGSSTETRDKDGKVQSGSKSSTSYDKDGKGTTTTQNYDPKTGTYK